MSGRPRLRLRPRAQAPEYSVGWLYSIEGRQPGPCNYIEGAQKRGDVENRDGKPVHPGQEGGRKPGWVTD